MVGSFKYFIEWGIKKCVEIIWFECEKFECKWKSERTLKPNSRIGERERKLKIEIAKLGGNGKKNLIRSYLAWRNLNRGKWFNDPFKQISKSIFKRI